MPRSLDVTQLAWRNPLTTWYAGDDLRSFQTRNQKDTSALPIALSHSLQLILLLDGI